MMIRSNKQALREIVQNLKIYSEAQIKHQKSIEEDKKRENRFLQLKRKEVEKDHSVL